MSDIFLSYKSEDKARAQAIAEALQKKGYSVWWDRVIPPGRRFSEVIQEELDEAKCVVVLWSKESVKSKWVETEASEGDRRGILVPVLIDDVLPPLAFRIIQAAKLIDWDGSLSSNEFDLLSKSVARILGSLELAKIEIQQPYELEKAKRKYIGKESKATKTEIRIQIPGEEKERTRETINKNRYQPNLQTNESLPTQSYRVFWTVVFWLVWVAYAIFSFSLFDNYGIGYLFLLNVIVVVVANIFTIKKNEIAPRILKGAAFMQICIMILWLYLSYTEYYYDYFENIGGINLAIAFVFYYFSSVSRTLINE